MASLYPQQMDQMLFSTPHHPFQQQQNGIQKSQDFDLADCIELESVQFVSPYEIHPIASPDSAVSQVSSKSVNTPETGDPMPINDMKLKMEEFSDLTALFSGASKIDLTGATDELGTPIFDKDAFNFANPPIKSIEINNQTDSKVKVEFNAQCGGKHIYRDLSLGTAASNVQNKENYSISRIVAVGDNQPEVNLYQPFAHTNLSFKDHTNDGTTILYSQDLSSFDNMAAFDSNLGVNFNNIKCSNSNVPSPQDDRYSYISSPGNEEPVEFNIPDLESLYKRKQRPNLMIDQFKFPIKTEGVMVLNTPDVIDEVVNMGPDFNILDLVDNEDITILNPDEELLLSLSSPSISSLPPSTPSTSSSKPASPRKFKRRLSYDDNDEDYLAPSKKKSTVCFADLDVEESDSSNDSYYYETKKPVRKTSKPRGRPPKRSGSVSSDYSKESNVSKYRELRDKNNEASRKSRMKRRQKEMEYEQEAEELRSRNLRLKTQVEELEKLVTTWRNNLLKVIISK